MNNAPKFEVDPEFKELLARNVPADFERVVGGLRNKLAKELAENRHKVDLGFDEIVKCLHRSPSPKDIKNLRGKLFKILSLYLAMKQSVDHVINPKEVSKEIDSLKAKLQTVEARLRNDQRDQLLVERLEIEDIVELGNSLQAFRGAGHIDERVVVTRLFIENTLKELSEMQSYFRYKADKVSGPGRRKNDYSIHYMIFALADLFNDVGEVDGAIMVSFNDDDEPISAFWILVKTFCDHLDWDVEKEYRGKFPEFIKTLCRRYQKTEYSTGKFTSRPDTQLLLDFMSVVHELKSNK
jgi:hypothetical protein